jgi:hypothetical protein
LRAFRFDEVGAVHLRRANHDFDPCFAHLPGSSRRIAGYFGVGEQGYVGRPFTNSLADLPA